MANCAQCGTKLPAFTFGDASPYCKTCRSQIPTEPKPDTYEALGTTTTQSFATAPTLATYALFAVNVAVFVAMVISGISIVDPGAQQVLKWGASYGPYTIGGQYWRLLTAMFLHFGIIHIAANMWCLWSLGRLAEKLLGPVSLICIYLLTGFGADLLSLSWNPMRVGAGASGAIFGIAGALITVLQFGNLGFAPENVSRMRSYVVRFALLNLFIGLKGHIDNMAHLGGLVTGLLIGFFLARTFNSPAEERPAQSRNIFAATAVVLLLLFVPLARSKQYAVEYGKGDSAFHQKDYKAAIEHMQKYVAERPDDAYAHAVMGASFENTGHIDDAVREYEQALAVAPDYDYVKENLVELYVKQSKPEKAIALYARNMQQIKDAETLYFYGQALKQTGNLSQAENALRKSILMDSKLIDSHQLLSQVLEAEGKIEEAKVERRIADLMEKDTPSPGNAKPAK